MKTYLERTCFVPCVPELLCKHYGAGFAVHDLMQVMVVGHTVED